MPLPEHRPGGDLPAGRSCRYCEFGFDPARSEAASGERSTSGGFRAGRQPRAAAAVLPVLRREMPSEGLAGVLRRDAVRRSDGGLPRFLCTACNRTETGVGWPSRCRSTPELDQLQAHLSALRQAGQLSGCGEPVDRQRSCEPANRLSAVSTGANGPIRSPGRAGSRPICWNSRPVSSPVRNLIVSVRGRGMSGANPRVSNLVPGSKSFRAMSVDDGVVSDTDQVIDDRRRQLSAMEILANHGDRQFRQ
jgi:hypothetical protein